MIRSAYLLHLKIVKETKMYRYLHCIRVSKLYSKKTTNFHLKNIHSSTQLYFKKNNQPNIEIDQNPKSVLSDDLKNILNSVSSEENAIKIDNLNEKKTVVEKKGLFATMFSRENSWKITLVFFSSMFGLCILYVLTNWGDIYFVNILLYIYY